MRCLVDMGHVDQIKEVIKDEEGLTNLYNKFKKKKVKKANEVGNLTGNLSRHFLNALGKVTNAIDRKVLKGKNAQRKLEICILLHLGSHLMKQRYLTYFVQKEIKTTGDVEEFITKVKKHCEEGDMVSKMVHECLNRKVQSLAPLSFELRVGGHGPQPFFFSPLSFLHSLFLVEKTGHTLRFEISQRGTSQVSLLGRIPIARNETMPYLQKIRRLLRDGLR